MYIFMCFFIIFCVLFVCFDFLCVFLLSYCIVFFNITMKFQDASCPSLAVGVLSSSVEPPLHVTGSVSVLLKRQV